MTMLRVALLVAFTAVTVDNVAQAVAVVYRKVRPK